jgi:hypothetical protein
MSHMPTPSRRHGALTALGAAPPTGRAYRIGKVARMHAQVRDYQTIERSTVLPALPGPVETEF